MDADVILVSTESIKPTGDWVSFNAGGGCYNIDTSKRFEQRVSHLKKELNDHLTASKTAFVLLSSQEEYMLAQSVVSTRKNERTYSTRAASNYEFLPIHLGVLTSASGTQMNFSGNNIFTAFDKKFRNFLKYEIYIENSKATQVIYSGKDHKKTLGAVYQVGSGHLVVLPMIDYNESEFLEEKVKDGEEEWFWNKKGIAFGSSLVNSLLEIDKLLIGASEKTPTPDWLKNDQYLLPKEIGLTNAISKKLAKIASLEKEIERHKVMLAEEVSLKDLLFENGKQLEVAVIRALKLLGYQAENFDNGELEMDQIIISPEKHRYIGECEGKDSKDIDVTKFRQLQDALNADFARDEVDEKAFGILFGNAERLKNPQERKLDFTAKCKSGAKRERIALVRTTDLFFVTTYLTQTKDEAFKKACRSAIHDQLGDIVVFPNVPGSE